MFWLKKYKKCKKYNYNWEENNIKSIYIHKFNNKNFTKFFTKRYQFSNIILKIGGEEKKNIFTLLEWFNNELYPNKIYINDNEQINEINSQYYLCEEENIIKLTRTNNINNINILFMDWYDIKQIGISDFDFSKITNINSLFINILLCSTCITDYYKKENDPLNLSDYFNCYKEPIGYYVDITESIYKQRYFTCETWNKKGDNKVHI